MLGDRDTGKSELQIASRIRAHTPASARQIRCSHSPDWVSGTVTLGGPVSLQHRVANTKCTTMILSVSKLALESSLFYSRFVAEGTAMSATWPQTRVAEMCLKCKSPLTAPEG
jgi:hypothetical protein